MTDSRSPRGWKAELGWNPCMLTAKPTLFYTVSAVVFSFTPCPTFWFGTQKFIGHTAYQDQELSLWPNQCISFCQQSAAGEIDSLVIYLPLPSVNWSA